MVEVVEVAEVAARAAELAELAKFASQRDWNANLCQSDLIYISGPANIRLLPLWRPQIISDWLASCARTSKGFTVCATQRQMFSMLFTPKRGFLFL